MARNIGLNVPIPLSECEDPNCPFHGTLPVR
ncbi:MAG: 30S ribosomal protein S17, partial [Euryarchaeota archaeon]|nr:30S ribosomal protein S17 [Euryarchaeota archaeon]